MIYFFGENITNEQRVKKDERKRQDPRFGAMLMTEGESTDSFSDFGIEFLCFGTGRQQTASALNY